jgi:hypothetical protein
MEGGVARIGHATFLAYCPFGQIVSMVRTVAV